MRVRRSIAIAVLWPILLLVPGAHANPSFNVWFHNNSSVTNFVAGPHPGVAIVTMGQTPDTAMASTAIKAGYAVMEGIGGGGGTGQSTADYINGWSCKGGTCTKTMPNLSIVTNGIDQMAADGATWIYIDEPGPAPPAVDPSQNLESVASMAFNVKAYNQIYNYIHAKYPKIKFGISEGLGAINYFHYDYLMAGGHEDFASYEMYNSCCNAQNPFIVEGTKAAFPHVLEMGLFYGTESLCQGGGRWPGPASTSGLDIIAGWDVDLYGGWIGPLMDRSFLPNLVTYASTETPQSFCQAPTSWVSPGDWTWATKTGKFTVAVNDFYFESGGSRGIKTCQYAVMAGSGAINGQSDHSMVTTVPWTNRTCNGNLTITVGSSGNCNVNYSGSKAYPTCLVFTRALDQNGVPGNTTYQEYAVQAQ